jgi:metallo-beta-lactamase family protein
MTRPSSASHAASSALTLAFHGAAGSVTGSCFLLRLGDRSVLIDCGMFQGNKTLQELNRRPLPFDAAALDAVLLTHAHIDHSGLVPRLPLEGFKGPILATAGTVDLLGFMLPDSGFIQESEARRFSRRNRQRGEAQAEPIYSKADAERCLDLIHPIPMGMWRQLCPGMRARFWDAGHILGSASIEIEAAGQKSQPPVRLLFSGDLGPGDKPFHLDPEGPINPDWLIVEATYGGRDRVVLHPDERRRLLAETLKAAFARGGPVVIPAFAVERTQELLYDLDRLFDARALPMADIFLDSPLAINITRIFDRHLPDINEPGTPPPFARNNLHLVEDVEASKGLSRIKGAAIIIAASGMCEAGRIRHHLKNNLWRREATVILTGYQAPGTLGRLLAEGVRRVRIHGEEIIVKAQIDNFDAYSGHADRQGLLRWIESRGRIGRGTFIVHGEEAERQALAAALAAAQPSPHQGADASPILIPSFDSRWLLSESGPSPLEESVPPRISGHAASAPTDWHNDYASTMLSMGATIRALPDDAQRRQLLQKIQGLLRAAEHS